MVMRRMKSMSEARPSLNDDTFAYMVAEEVKNKLSPSQRQILLQKENWERWQATLVALVDNLNGQLQVLEENEEADANRFGSAGSRRLQKEVHSAYGNRRSKIERFRFHVNRRLDEVTRMIETGEESSENPWDKVDFYKRAIFQHRKMMQDNDLEPTPIDEALWATLTDRWEFDRIDTSLL